jgi:hypothetical protein
MDLIFSSTKLRTSLQSVFANLPGRQESFLKRLGTIQSGALHTQSQDFLEPNPIHPQILVA